LSRLQFLAAHQGLYTWQSGIAELTHSGSPEQTFVIPDGGAQVIRSVRDQDYLPANVSLFDISDCRSSFAERVLAVDHRTYLAGLHKLGEQREIFWFRSGDEEYNVLAENE